MNAEWREATLGEVAELVMGQSPPGSTYNESGEGLPFFQGVRDFNYRHPTPRVYCSEPARVAQAGDILLSVRAPIGRVNVADRECATGRGLAIITARMPSDARFLEFALRSLESSWSVLETSGSVFGNATRRDLEALPMFWPNRESERSAIAHVLGALDDKIELNRRMNETLEGMARAVFHDWFVDFGPVRAKMEGREPYLPPEVWSLFPERLAGSELGGIPEGWGVKALGDELEILVSGSRPRGGAVDAGIPSIGAENVNGLGRHDFAKEKFIPEDFYDRLQKKGATVRDGDVLLYKDGAHVGRKTFLDRGYPHAKCAVNEHVFTIRLYNGVGQRYLFFWLDQEWMTGEIQALNSNTAQPGINQVGVRSLPFLSPSCDILSAFDEIARRWTDRLFANCHESRTLAAQRDALLPRLVSGAVGGYMI